MRFVNATSTPDILTFEGETFNEDVRIKGNYSVIFTDCTFNGGLFVLNEGMFSPQVVTIQTSRFNSLGHNYPIKISAVSGPRIKKIILNTVTIKGSGKPHPEGTPDQVSIQNAHEVLIQDTYSLLGGENGYSINGCNHVDILRSTAACNDGQGFHIGKHEDEKGRYDPSVGFVTMKDVYVIDNWRNLSNTDGSGVGVLLHSVGGFEIRNLFSSGHEYPLSAMRFGGRGGYVDGVSYDRKRALFTSVYGYTDGLQYKGLVT